MTTVYFIRHAQSDRFVHDDRTRPLTTEGLEDTKLITEALADAGIKHILSSPYTRTIQTVTHLARQLDIPIQPVENFRERYAGTWHGEDFIRYIESQWNDFNYHILDGECLADVQKRNIDALENALETYRDEVIAIATHGTALSTILNFYDPEYCFENFMRILDYMPYIVKMEFDSNNKCVSFEEVLIVEKKYK